LAKADDSWWKPLIDFNYTSREQQFLVKNSRQVTICSASILSALGQGDKVFSICHGTGEF